MISANRRRLRPSPWGSPARQRSLTPDTGAPTLLRWLLVQLQAVAFDMPFGKHPPIGKSDASRFHARRAGLSQTAGNRDLIPWLKDVLAEAGFRKRVRIGQFGPPMHHIALVVGHIEQKPAVRIGPNPFCYGSLQRDHFLRVVRNPRAVVCG